jgi:hypothetical protein
MNDIVGRLRALDAWALHDAKAVMCEAADEIDRLREALRYWLHDDEVEDFGEWFEAGCKIARVALGEDRT